MQRGAPGAPPEVETSEALFAQLSGGHSWSEVQKMVYIPATVWFRAWSRLMLMINQGSIESGCRINALMWRRRAVTPVRLLEIPCPSGIRHSAQRRRRSSSFCLARERRARDAGAQPSTCASVY